MAGPKHNPRNEPKSKPPVGSSSPLSQSNDSGSNGKTDGKTDKEAELKKVRLGAVGPKGVSIDAEREDGKKGNPEGGDNEPSAIMHKEGDVLLMTQQQIDQHRAAGIPLMDFESGKVAKQNVGTGEESEPAAVDPVEPEDA